jgi:hypothetical protein
MCRFRSLCSLDLAGFSDRLLAEKGVGKGAAALVPAQNWRDPERDQRSEFKRNFRVPDKKEADRVWGRRGPLLEFKSIFHWTLVNYRALL